MVASLHGLRSQDPFRSVHVLALALCAIMLPWSTVFLSIAQMLLVVNWLAEGVVRGTLGDRLRKGLTSLAPLVFISIFLLHVLGLLWTDNLEWGMDLVRILLPILSFTPVLATAAPLTRSEFRAVLLFGAWSAVVSTFVGSLMHTGGAMDYRLLSVFISHIRLTLLLCLAIVILWLEPSSNTNLRWAGYGASLWCAYFINELASIQGFVILALLCGIFLWRWAGGLPVGKKWSFRAVLILVPLLTAIWGVREVSARYRLPDPGLEAANDTTAYGELYVHDLNDPQMENGTHVWTYIAWRELYAAWPARSSIPIDSLDAKGNELRSTLARFISSKGLRKDSLAVMSLSDDEVHAIEQGVTNVMQGKRNKLRERFEEVTFELEHYYAFGAADGHSVAMRMEFLKAGVAIAKRNWLFGVGTGDTPQAFAEEYERMGTSLSEEYRHRAHNEYLTIWISFGVFGLLWVLFAIWWPAYHMGAWQRPHFIAWIVIFGISCLTDDTTETQAGATFFAVYFALFVFGVPRVAGP